jgi:CHAT domain-containing protein
MDSVLQLADGAVDGLEISSWPLERCGVVTLSACEAGQLAITGRGMDELPGDEMFGLPAAFLEAGARSVLASVWPAVEEGGEIIVSFHRHIAAGVAADLALQAAQCEYLDARAGAPARAYFWAGLFLLSLGRLAVGLQQSIQIDHRSVHV